MLGLSRWSKRGEGKEGLASIWSVVMMQEMHVDCRLHRGCPDGEFVNVTLAIRGRAVHVV